MPVLRWLLFVMLPLYLFGVMLATRYVNDSFGGPVKAHEDIYSAWHGSREAFDDLCSQVVLLMTLMTSLAGLYVPYRCTRPWEAVGA